MTEKCRTKWQLLHFQRPTPPNTVILYLMTAAANTVFRRWQNVLSVAATQRLKLFYCTLSAQNSLILERFAGGLLAMMNYPRKLADESTALPLSQQRIRLVIITCGATALYKSCTKRHPLTCIGWLPRLCKLNCFQVVVDGRQNKFIYSSSYIHFISTITFSVRFRRW